MACVRCEQTEKEPGGHRKIPTASELESNMSTYHHHQLKYANNRPNNPAETMLREASRPKSPTAVGVCKVWHIHLRCDLCTHRFNGLWTVSFVAGWCSATCVTLSARTLLPELRCSTVLPFEEAFDGAYLCVVTSWGKGYFQMVPISPYCLPPSSPEIRSSESVQHRALTESTIQ